MQTQLLPDDYQHMSPAGAEVRLLIGNAMGGLAHCTLPSGKISKPVAHKTVNGQVLMKFVISRKVRGFKQLKERHFNSGLAPACKNLTIR